MMMICSLAAVGAESGLRFKAHDSPGRERTGLSLGEPFKLKDQLSMTFDMGFYDEDCFGLICTLDGDDGLSISLVSSAHEEGYSPGIIINDRLYRMPSEFNPGSASRQHMEMMLDKAGNNLTVRHGEETARFPVALSHTSEVTVSFGSTYKQNVIAPMEVENIAVGIDGNRKFLWKLREHQSDTVKDVLNGRIAVASSPIWILDEHVNWQKIYEMRTQDTVQTAFNPRKSLFYIVSQDKITVFDPRANTERSMDVAKDGRVMKYSNYLLYDTLSNTLLSFDITTRMTSRFDFSTRSWSCTDTHNELPNHSNHAYASDGRNAYLFGGYGYYRYHNNLVKLDLANGDMTDLALSPPPQPRTSSAMSVVGGKIYIFGGFGNHMGNQELPGMNYYDMWEYDSSTLKGRMLWATDTVRRHYLPSSTMYYSERDTCFYFASTLRGGCMMRTFVNKPEFNQMSMPIRSKMDYRDCVFDLYRSDDQQAYYLVIDKRIDMTTHDYAIYRLMYPFVETGNTDIAVSKPQRRGTWPAILLGVTAVCVVVSLALWLGKRKKGGEIREEDTVKPPCEESPVAEPTSTAGTESEMVVEKSGDDFVKSFLAPVPSTGSMFDMGSSSITLLGGFTVMDRNGNDMTSSFRSRIKALLTMLVLYSERDEKGVDCRTIDEKIWPDMDEKSAKKNRNVCIHKLRQLLSEVGDAEISYDKGYYRFVCADVTIDYREVMKRLKQFESTGMLSGTPLDETMELLLRGPLLPDTSYEWLDNFKSGYTEYSLQILNRLLEHVKTNDDSVAYKVAETISRHDSLNETALAVKCRILHAHNMKGLAKEIYDRFCRQYKESYGEDYNVPFSRIFKACE